MIFSVNKISKMEIILFFVFFLININIINSNHEKDIFEGNKNLRFCGADLKNNGIEQYISRANQNKKRKLRNLDSTTYRPIRIYLETTYFQSQGNNNQNIKDKMSSLITALNKAVNGIKGLINVEDIGDKNILSGINMPELFQNNNINQWNTIFNSGSNINADYLLIVKFDNTNMLTNSVLASAIPIYPDPDTNRPLIGLLTVSTNTSFYNKGRFTEYFSLVFLHELTHALGFLYSLFNYYPNGLSNTVKSYVIRGVTRNLIITPTVIQVAKKYFNCSSINGVELEDQGGEGSQDSHWEQRVLLGEYM